MLSRIPLRPRTVLALGLLALVAVIVALGKLVDGPAAQTTPPADVPAARSTVDPSAGNDGVQEPVPTPSAFRPRNGPEAVTVATAFAKSWVQHDRSAKVWRDALLPHCTEALATELDGVDPVGVPANRITGPATVEAHADTYVDVVIPIDAGLLRLHLVAPEIDGQRRWLVDGIDWERV